MEDRIKSKIKKINEEIDIYETEFEKEIRIVRKITIIIAQLIVTTALFIKIVILR